MSRTVFRTCLPLVVVALSACGSSSKKSSATPATDVPTTTVTTAPETTTTTAPAKLDACALVTKAQAQSVIGTTLQDGVSVANADLNSCTYAGDPSGPTAQVEVFVGAGAKKFYDDDNTVLQHTFTDVPGLGDESHEEDFALFFRKGSTWVALRLTSLDDFATFKPRLEALGKDVASRI
jgi:hypothetical protein